MSFFKQKNDQTIKCQKRLWGIEDKQKEMKCKFFVDNE